MTDNYRAIKDRIDIVAEIQKRTGFQIGKAGEVFNLAECPFCHGHECFRINPTKKMFNCFQCDAGGDIFDFVRRHQGLSSKEALKELAASIGYLLIDPHHKPFRNSPRAPENAVFEAASEYYHKALFTNPSALNYQRKIRYHSDKILKEFKVGYSTGELHIDLQKLGFSPEQLIESGLVRKKDGRIYDFFHRGLSVYPHFDFDGHVSHFTAKKPNSNNYYQLSKEFRRTGCRFYNVKAFEGNVIVLTEGENDLLSIYGRGEIQHVVACCGQLSKEQVDYIKSWAAASPVKTIYLCFDNDEAGQRYTRQIEEALKKFCLSDRLMRINSRLQIQSLEKKDEDMRFIPKAWQTKLKRLHFNRGHNDIDDFLKAEKEPQAAFARILDNAVPVLIPLKNILALHKSWHDGLGIKAAINEAGELVFDYFQNQGTYFVDGEKCCLYYNDNFYEINANIAFKSMLYETAGLNFAVSTTKNIIEVLQVQAYARGCRTISTPGWLHSDIPNKTIFFNLCNDRNELVRLEPGKVSVIPNGTNSDKVLLQPSRNMKPIEYRPDVDIRPAMALFKTRVLDNLTCKNSDRYFIACIIFNTLLIQFTRARGITKFSGSHSSAKSGATGFISTLIYGENMVSVGTAASNFSEATSSPLVTRDNLESDSLKHMQEFLLLAATGITKQKRRQNSDSENVYERICTQVIVNGIEPFTQDELISRATDIIFDKIYFNPEFVETIETEALITEARNSIWSAFFHILVSDILPGFGKRRQKVLKWIKSAYPGHAKERLNELYSCLYIICEELIKYIRLPYNNPETDGSFRTAQEVFSDWMETQNRIEQDTTQETNPLLYHLNILLKDCLVFTEDGFKATYRLEGVKLTRRPGGEPIGVKLIASSGDLFWAFNLIAKNSGGKNPYKSVRQLSARIKDAVKILEQNGWEYVPKEKTVRGDQKRSFTKYFDENS